MPLTRADLRSVFLSQQRRQTGADVAFVLHAAAAKMLAVENLYAALGVSVFRIKAIAIAVSIGSPALSSLLPIP